MGTRAESWRALNDAIVRCQRCPRLIQHCRTVAQEKRRAYQNDEYWGRPVPNLGRVSSKLLIVGLAPGAHGANRTGRMFTGDRSGDWLFRAMHRAGFCNKPESISLDDGLRLRDCAITAACHCAPPGNKPSSQELEDCQEWYDHTVELMKPRVFLALGQIGWITVLKHAKRKGWFDGRRPSFGHAAEFPLAGSRNKRWLLGSYHPSQQNTFTGRLTEAMLDDVFRRARELILQ